MFLGFQHPEAISGVSVLNFLRQAMANRKGINDFSVLEQSGEQARALQLGARIVSVKRLHEGVMQKIDAGSSSFWKAKNTNDPAGAGLGLMDRQRVKMWLRDVYREIDDVGI